MGRETLHQIKKAWRMATRVSDHVRTPGATVQCCPRKEGEADGRLGDDRDQLLLRFPRHARRVLLHAGKLIDPRISDGDTILPVSVAPPSAIMRIRRSELSVDSEKVK